MGTVFLSLLYLVAAFGGFVSPYDPNAFSDYPFTPPQRVRFVDAAGQVHLRPFVYLLDQSLNMRTLAREYAENRAEKRFVRFLTRGYEYKLFGMLPTDIHLFAVDAPGTLHLFGTDNLGRDLFSRNVYGAAISLTIGLVGVMLSFVLGCLLGGVSGYFGGTSDTIIQRIIEFLLSILQIPLWMALSAALPTHWSPMQDLLRHHHRAVHRRLDRPGAHRARAGARPQGRRLCACGQDLRRRRRAGHLQTPAAVGDKLPDRAPHAGDPGHDPGRDGLSFLGLGMQPPAISWGTLLKDGQDIRSLALYPWLLIPGLFVIVVVLAFNFLGDGLRDAADPYRAMADTDTTRSPTAAGAIAVGAIAVGAIAAGTPFQFGEHTFEFGRDVVELEGSSP